MASSTSDPTPGDLDRFRPLDPSIRVDYDDYINSEEHYPVEKYELTTLDLILFITRCAIILFFIIFFVLVRSTTYGCIFSGQEVLGQSVVSL